MTLPLWDVCVSEGNDCEYRKVIMNFVDWCELNHLQVNAKQDKGDGDRLQQETLIRDCTSDDWVIGERRVLDKLSTIMDNTSHPLHQTVGALSSSFSNRLRHPRCRKERFHRCPPPGSGGCHATTGTRDLASTTSSCRACDNGGREHGPLGLNVSQPPSESVRSFFPEVGVEDLPDRGLGQMFPTTDPHNTFGSARRQDVVRDKPMIADFKTRWPGLFTVAEDETVEKRRECILRALCTYLNEDPSILFKEYLVYTKRSGVHKELNVRMKQENNSYMRKLEPKLQQNNVFSLLPLFIHLPPLNPPPPIFAATLTFGKGKEWSGRRQQLSASLCRCSPGQATSSVRVVFFDLASVLIFIRPALLESEVMAMQSSMREIVNTAQNLIAVINSTLQSLSVQVNETHSGQPALRTAGNSKGTGGSGQRPLTTISPETEGYTGAIVHTASNGGKSVLYIVPQGEIDMTPLPLSSKEFDKIPKAYCSRTTILHSLARLLPMLDQMRKGLQLYNLPDVMEKNIDLCRPLFVPLQDNKPDANFIMASCKPDFSEQGTSRHNLEQSLLNCFQDFLQELEDNGKKHVHLSWKCILMPDSIVSAYNFLERKKALNCQTPSYLKKLIVPYYPTRVLLSLNADYLRFQKSLKTEPSVIKLLLCGIRSQFQFRGRHPLYI
ncbi:hypothetical protein L3Q82_020960 [Scortum barcoo]|uniref:Uncharacterized protein n=1 Tax=Scortum barcoo TaxID=214431 RepID=A0ACB8V9L7_9TELE|nr:hypothetical protein L3Q82_020960 [Scortum barcoo]